MSKSDPDSAIFMEDTVEDVNRKIKKAFCPEKLLKDEEGNANPILDYCESIIFPAFGVFSIRFKGVDKPVEFKSYEQLEEAFTSGELHPGDLKPAVAEAINALLQPVRDHFSNDPYAKKLLETIKRWQAEAAAKSKK